MDEVIKSRPAAAPICKGKCGTNSAKRCVISLARRFFLCDDLRWRSGGGGGGGGGDGIEKVTKCRTFLIMWMDHTLTIRDKICGESVTSLRAIFGVFWTPTVEEPISRNRE